MAEEASILELNRLGANLIYFEHFLIAEEATQLMQRLPSTFRLRSRSSTG